eukprot:TRINITY_DN59821_c0_g1_i1.p1 TRINITY_DN59821_c0_g1~~TRINITY_DN59821_c0_g1_i1.p1  ORF type:complete len:719 (-),score=137.52 TRINITY_DN59821_c0_g1_i1:301-2457(-)
MPSAGLPQKRSSRPAGSSARCAGRRHGRRSGSADEDDEEAQRGSSTGGSFGRSIGIMAVVLVTINGVALLCFLLTLSGDSEAEDLQRHAPLARTALSEIEMLPPDLPPPPEPGLRPPRNLGAMLTMRPPPDPRSCKWTTHESQFLGELVKSGQAGMPLEEAKALCAFDPMCKGVTCEDGASNMKCTTRKGQPFLGHSPTGEYSYTKQCETHRETDDSLVLLPDPDKEAPSVATVPPVPAAAVGAQVAAPPGPGDSGGGASSQANVKKRFVVAVVAHNNPEDLRQCLDALTKQASGPDADHFAFAVSLDEAKSFSRMEAVVQEFRRRVPIDVWHLTEFRGPKGGGAVSKISEHHRFALQESFAKGYEYAVILEQDLQAAPDFLHFFYETSKLLEQDPSLFCVSSWNDNGFKGMVRDERRLFRTDYFPGLGWMMRSDTWKLVGQHWPRFPSTGWDHWMRHGSGLILNSGQKRECIVPEVPRTHHFGTKGTNVHAGNSVAAMLERLALSNLPAGELGDLSYLLKDQYEGHLKSMLEGAETVRGGAAALMAMRLEAGKTYLVPYVREEYKDLATKLQIISSQPRTAHRGLIVTFRAAGSGRATIALVDRRQGGAWLPEAEIWKPNPRRKVAVASPGESCDKFCGRQSMRCEDKELEFVNKCMELRKVFPCEDGCGHQVGQELPAFVHDKTRDTARQCLVTDDVMSLCRNACPATTRLCVCVP